MGNMGKGHLYLTLREQPAATGIATGDATYST
jgi:hypothetical protein